MKKGLKRAVAIASAVSLLGGTVGALAACKKTPDPIPDANLKKGTYRQYTSVLPSMWNELDSMDANNDQIMGYLGSAFYEFDYKFDETRGGKFNKDGSVNADAIIDGEFEVKYSAATKLEDVTSTVDAKWGYTDEQKEAGGYAWKLTLREDLKWDDGTPIDATDFVYTMQQQLDPKFGFQRANSYYGAISVKGAKDFAYSGKKGWYAASTAYDLSQYAEELDSKLIFSLGNAEENAARGKAKSYIRADFIEKVLKDSGASAEQAAEVTAEQAAGYCVQLLEPEGVTAEDVFALEGKTFAEIKADDTLKATWDALIVEWQTDPGEEMHFMVTEYEFPTVSFDTVGVYSPSKYELVVCFTASEEFLKEDGSLSYLAAYHMASLPLVHREKFESSIVQPSEGQTLYTSRYNTSLATTASWGPYKLTEYQSGKGYTLSRNDNWYGYGIADNKNQYNVTAIKCEVVSELNTQWMKMLKGEIDAIGIDPDHADDYRNSRYTYYTPGTYTFSWHLYSGLDVLKNNDRNNGILAINDFRKALSLAIDRDAYAANVTTAYRGAFGYLNSMYYYDVENGGVYRNTDVAKKAILRAYGYTENEQGLWSLSTNENLKDLDLEEAYETVTGYNINLAKEYLEKAYKELTDNAEKYGYNPSKNIQIKFGTSVDDDSTRKEYNYINDHVLPALLEGTSLEGKVELLFDASFGNQWSSKFLAGEYELCTSAWGQATFDPYYFIGAYIDPANAYTASYWDTETVEMTFQMPAGNFPGAGEELTMSLMNWYNCLNGYEHGASDKYTYDWGVGKVSPEIRNEVLAAIEEFILTQYYSIPVITQNSATLVSAKFSYISDVYNTFMKYGSVRYYIVNYTDEEWDAFVKAQPGGNLESLYKLTD